MKIRERNNNGIRKWIAIAGMEEAAISFISQQYGKPQLVEPGC
jgi:hypothetical protein